MSIVSIDYTRQGKGSIFECDRCHRKINTKKEKRYVIDISKSKLGQSGLEKIKKFDFCGNCIRKYLKEGDK
ncbi:MAG: hypothetical protein J6O41_02195 [Clostridia bacterium]|nr:hypothetical protein [Clostridia bacterium]